MVLSTSQSSGDWRFSTRLSSGSRNRAEARRDSPLLGPERPDRVDAGSPPRRQVSGDECRDEQ